MRMITCPDCGGAGCEACRERSGYVGGVLMGFYGQRPLTQVAACELCDERPTDIRAFDLNTLGHQVLRGRCAAHPFEPPPDAGGEGQPNAVTVPTLWPLDIQRCTRSPSALRMPRSSGGVKRATSRCTARAAIPGCCWCTEIRRRCASCARTGASAARSASFTRTPRSAAKRYHWRKHDDRSN